MKRLLSLALCLVMVLGLFTGVVGAETIATLVIQDDFGTVIGPNSNPTLQTGLFSQFGFNAYKDSVDEANSIGNLTLVDSEGNPTDQLGVLKPGPVGTWDYLMNTDNAHPGATGYLYATEGDVTYRLPVRIDSGWTSGVYADAECKTYIPPKGRTFLLSDITANPLCYIAIVCDNSATAPQVSDNRFELGEAIRKELDGTLYDVYGLNLKPDAEFSGTSSFQITSSLLDGDWIPTITVTDGLILTPTETDGSAMNTTDMPAWGSPGINLTYGMDYTPVPANAVITVTPDEGWTASDLGKLYYEPGSYNGQSWSWILDRGYAIPGASGTYSVTIEGKTYSFHASFATPEIVVCTLSGGNPIPLPYANIRQSFPSDDATFLVLPNTGVTITTLYSNNGFRSQVDIAEQIGGYYTISPREGIKSDISEEIIVEYTDQWNSNCSASFQIVFEYQPPVLQPEKNVTEYEPLRKNSHEFASFEHKGVT